MQLNARFRKNIIGRHGPGGEPLIRFEPHAAPKLVNNETPVEPSGGNGPAVTIREKSEGVEAAGKAADEAGTAPIAEQVNQPGPTAKPDVTGGEVETGTAPAKSGSASAKDVATAAEDRTGGESQPVVQQRRWAGRPVGSDLPAEPVRPAVGHGVTWAERPSSRYEAAGRPSAGTSDSEILVDKTNGKKYLFKPTKGEKMVPAASERGVKKGTYAARAKASEIAAGELDIATPGVELVSIGGRKGSLTEWVEQTGPDGRKTMSLGDYLRPTKETSDLEAHQRLRELQTENGFAEAWANIQALDYLINNVDRFQNFGNYLIEFDSAGKFAALLPINSELSFTTTSGRAVIEMKTSFLEGLTYTQASADKLRELGAHRDTFADQIRPLVGDAAVEGVMARLDLLIADANRKAPAKRATAQSTP